MNRERQKAIVQLIGTLAAMIVSLCSAYLIMSYVLARHQETFDKVLVESMEEAVKMDAAVSVELTAEREKQTTRALDRSKRNDRAATLLMFGAALFLAAMNWRKSIEDEPVLSLERLQLLQGIAPPAYAEPETQLWNLEPTEEPEIDLTFVEEVVQQKGTAPDAAIPILRGIQQHYGYLPDEALKRVCELTEITPAQIAGTSTFYAQFRRSPVGKHLVRICHGTACHVSGAVQVTEELRRYLSIPPDEDTDPSRLFTLERVACLGCCSLAPVMMIDDQTVGRLTPTSACHSLQLSESEKSA